jgi:RHS repeat-associated protein
MVFQAGEAGAQAKSPTDGFTPLAMTPGAPSGSFALSGFENANLFNGNLSFHLPLLHVGGRGEAGYTLTLTVERRINFRFSHQASGHDTRGIYMPQFNWFDRDPGFSPGVMSARKASQEVVGGLETALQRLTFTAADGTEYEFRDAVHGGRPVRAPNDPNPTSRGRRFITADGSWATFEADADILDQGGPSLLGWLSLRNGVRYRTNAGGQVTKIIDRNGNTVELEYVGLGVTKVTDSLGRVVTVTTVSDDAGKLRQTIRYLGFRGVPREIQVHFDDLANRLSGPSSCEGGGVCRCSELFPPVDFDAFDQACNPRVVASVDLPNTDAQHPEQATHYDFRYNEYGELAKVELPTGGFFAYEWEPGEGTRPPGGIVELPFNEQSRSYAWALYRRVKSRKVYNYGEEVQSTVYSQCPSEGAMFCVTATHSDPMHGDAILGMEDHYFHGGPTDSYFREPCDYPDPLNGREAYSRTYDGSSRSLGWLREVSQDWEEGAPVPCEEGIDCTSLHLPANFRLKRVITHLETPQQFKIEYTYDDFNNVTSKDEFDYDAPQPSRTTQTSFNRQSPYLQAHLLSLPAKESVYDGEGLRSETTFTYDEGTPAVCPGISGWNGPYGSVRGNVTTVSQYLDSPVSQVATHREYDQAGNVVKIIDPLDRATRISYADDFGIPNGRLQEHLGLNTFAFPTSVVRPRVNDRPHETRTQYDYSTGMAVDQQDENGTVTSFYHDDLLDRLTRVVKAANAGNQSYRSQTGFEYLDGRYFREVRTYADKNKRGDAYVQHRVKYDELGRETHLWTRDAGRTDGSFIEVRKEYDARSRVFLVSNPHNEHDVTDPLLWTQTDYDILDRPIRVRTPDNADTIMSYSGNVAAVTDPAGKSRSSTTDALGRVALVTEAPGDLNYGTTYGYDARDRLVGVQQGGQSRTFTYDTLGRLRSAENPESGLVRYEYDPAGNLKTRTDARNVVTTTDYDALNRPFQRTYNDGTPAVTFTYDLDASLGTFPIGRLTKMSNAVSESAYHHDPLGRVFKSSHTTDGTTYSFAYGYDLQDNLVKERYPSGRLLTTTLDNQERVISVADVAQTYASNYKYASHSAPVSLRLGNNLWESTLFNSRLQPTAMGLGTSENARNVLALDYQYWPVGGSPSQNNGNVHQQTISAAGFTMTQKYSYDGANRLKTAEEVGGWPLTTYDYDRYGNRAVLAGYVPQPNVTPRSLADFEPLNNRLRMGSAYDDAGNHLNVPLGRTSTYDAENRIAITNNCTTTYRYDGEGRRVLKLFNSGEQTAYVYDTLGRLAAEYGGPPAFSGTRFMTQDPLGSKRVVTDDSMTVLGRHDFLPFGEEIPKTVGLRPLIGAYEGLDAVRHRFTGKERDFETGLDYFGARYFSGGQGRFTSSDPKNAGADPLNPQSWNGYAYVLNSPLKYIDPDGESATLIGALVGGVAGGATTIIRSALSGQLSSGREIAAGVVGGAVYGGMMGSVIDSGGTTLPVLLAAGAMSGAAAVTAQHVVLGTSTSVGDLAEGSANGMVGAAMLAPAVSVASRAGIIEGGDTAAPPSVQANKARGDAFRDEVAGSLQQAGRTIQTEVTKKTPFGLRVVDLEVRMNGKVLGGVETKTGNSRYTPSQRAKDWYLEYVLNYQVDLVRRPPEP